MTDAPGTTSGSSATGRRPYPPPPGPFTSSAAAGRNTVNDRAAARRSSTQARPPWSSANRRTSESPIADPGRVLRLPSPGACRNGSKIASCRSLGHARALVLDRQRACRRPGHAPEPRYACSAGVCRIAFDTRFSTIRSTFAASIEHDCRTRPRPRSRGRSGSRSPATARRDQLGRGRSAVAAARRSRAAAGRGRAGPRAAVRASVRSPRSGGRGRARPRAGASSRVLLQRERRTEDRGERGAEVVRDGLEERVLHLVERSEPLRRLAFAPEGLGVLPLARRSACSARLRSVMSTISPRS